MSCKDCFNGCVETTSDKCVKYTGVPVPELGIETGDSLASVEAAIIENLVSVLDGTGIILDISEELICELIQAYLPTSENITLVDYITALVQATCNLQDQVTANTEKLAVEDADYVVECLPNASPGDGTHAILQDLIGLTCQLKIDFEEFILYVDTNFVKLVDLDGYIQDYLDNVGTSTLIKNKMVPYAVVEYYGSLSHFDQSGAGTGDWLEIYLCNGANNTPDKRGRLAVGATTGMGGGVLAPSVDPIFPGNPDYSLLMAHGSNTITITQSQMPSHTHEAIAEVTDDGHTHNIIVASQDGSGSTNIDGSDESGNPKTTHTAFTGIQVAVTNGFVGGGAAHDNIQPVLACYYIMYIPSI